MNTTDYLKRINSEQYRAVSLQNLKQLQKNHLAIIPFENLSLMIKQQVTMNIETMYSKVINNHRGGFCFELNQLFAWLLNQLGYDIKLVPCRVYGIQTRTYTPWYSHVAIIVKLEHSEYLVDVGFSTCYQAPIEFIENKIQNDLIGNLKIVSATETQMDKSFTLLRNATNESNDWTPMYQFSAISHQIEEFKPMLEWVQSPECPRFFNRSICVIHSEKGLLMLVGFRLTRIEFENGIEIKREDRALETREQVYQLLKTEFNLVNFNYKFEPIDII